MTKETSDLATRVAQEAPISVECGGFVREELRVEYGDMGSASVPFALDRAGRGAAPLDGGLVLSAGFGGGSIGVRTPRRGVPA
ncbi:hypothetical protein [Streptomyces sp. XD-27]|uniref:hypothetical protein n=1 Tax=Streptomyces sp. XD-27 TaxID=3062779 RepID=UPI0026F470FF|nr:hypothetical protein [Streptomyces sp. XD-27]WKX71556.1 hypothetical protein Q3Y56_18015 [Streptomyces sp. XD-27]